MTLRPLAAVLAALAAAVALAGCGGDESADVPTDAVAVVDGEAVPRSTYDQLIAQAKKTYEQQKRDFPKAGTPQFQELKNQAVAFLVQREQFDQEAAELEVEVTDKQVEDRLKQIKSQYFGGKQEQYDKQLKEQGLTDAQVRADIRAQLTSEAIYEKVTKDVKVSDADVKKYYEQNKAQFGTPESRVVRHILVKTKKQADDLFDRIKGGEDFAKLARQFSQDTASKAKGGELTITRGQTVAPFDQTAFLLNKGSTSRPVKTEYGYHIIQPVGDVKPAKTTPLNAAVKTQIRTTLEQQKKTEAMTKWVEELKEQYDGKINYAVGFAPPAGSETETGETDTGDDG